MNMRAIIPLVLGLGIGIFAVRMFVNTLKKAEGANQGDTVQVVQANAEIEATTAISEAMIKVVNLPKALLPSGCSQEIDQVLGRVANQNIPAGIPIMKSMLAPEGTPPGLAARIEEGYRAVAVKVNEYVGVAGWIKPGSHVDVVVVMDIKDNATNKKSTLSKVVLSNVEVLAIGQEIQSKGELGASLTRSITLLVKQDDVAKLHLSETKGELRLAMRGTRDNSLTGGKTTTDKELLGLAGTDNKPKKSGRSFLSRLFGKETKVEPKKTDKPVTVVQSVTPAPLPPQENEWMVEVVSGQNVYEVGFENSKKGAKRIDEAAPPARQPNPFNQMRMPQMPQQDWGPNNSFHQNDSMNPDILDSMISRERE